MKIHFHGGQGTRQWKSGTMRLVAEKWPRKESLVRVGHLPDRKFTRTSKTAAFLFLVTLYRCDSLRLVTPPPSSPSPGTRTWLIFTASCVSQPKKNEVFPVYDLINIETRGQCGIAISPRELLF